MSGFPVVTRDDASAAFFDAAARGELLVQRCTSCATVVGPEVRTCPACGEVDLVDHVAAGTGSVVSWVVVHSAPLPLLADAVPYVSAVVELDEGPWLIVRLLDDDPSVGLAVRAVFVEVPEGEALVAFARA